METTAAKGAALRGDLFGGITAGIVALPLALAFGVASGLGATYGLYGAIFIGFFAAIFGGTAVQISGPTGPMTVVTAVAVKEIVESTGTIEAALPVLVATFVLAGLLQIGMGFVGIGTLIKFIPYPVVSGFMSGIGVIIILVQVFPAVGLDDGPSRPLDVVLRIGEVLRGAHFGAIGLTLLTIAIIYVFPRVTRAVPSVLVALLGVTIVEVAFVELGVPIIGDIPKGFPSLHLDGLFSIDGSMLLLIAEFAATLAALGAIDSLLTSVVADNLTKTRHDSNRELIGQGIGNTISGMFVGLPGAGATMRTVVNIKAGGRTRLSGAVHSLVLLVILLGAGTYAAHIPTAVLAGILITVGIGILDYRGLRHLARVPRADAAVTLIVLFVTVFFDLLVAVGIGVLMAALMFMRRMAEAVEDGVELERLSAFADEEQWADEHIPPEIEQSVLVKRITGPLFFGFAQTFQQQLQKLPQVRYVILRLKRVPFIDQTGAYALEEAVRSLEQRGVSVLITGMHGQPRDLLRRLRIVPDRIHPDHKFEKFEHAVAFLKKTLRGHAGDEAAPKPGPMPGQR